MTARTAWLAVILSCAAAAAHGEPVDEVRGHIERGVAAYRARQFAKAVDELLQANRLAPAQPEPYRWLAAAEVELDDCPSALINIDAFVARVPPGDPRIAELATLRDRCVGSGRVDIDSTPSGATLSIDGGPPIGATPIKRLAMRAGPHTLTLEKPGFVPLSHPIDVRPFGVDYATFSLRPDTDRPMYREWWFWPTIGAVAIVTAGIAIAATRSSDRRLPAVMCMPYGCTP
jgi:hypothetical protein